MKPLSQIVGGRQVAEPLVHGSAVFAQTAWPKAVHQYARSVRARGRFIYSFHGYSFCRHWIPALSMALLYYCSGLLKRRMERSRILFSRRYSIENPKWLALCFCVFVGMLWFLMSCDVQRRKSDAELGLNPQQIAGRRIYDNYGDRCHAPYSSRGRQGPSMKG